MNLMQPGNEASISLVRGLNAVSRNFQQLSVHMFFLAACGICR